MKTTSRRRHVLNVSRWSLIILLVGVAAGCQPHRPVKAAVAAASLTVLDPPEVREAFKAGQIRLDKPDRKPPVEGNAVVSKVKADPVIARLLADGYVGSLQFAAYTNMTIGESAIGPNGDPLPGPPTLTFDHTPAWTVQIKNISAADSSFMAFGPPDAPARTASEDLLFVFSSDGSQFLTGTIYPTP